jgi:hypothetical protein
MPLIFSSKLTPVHYDVKQTEHVRFEVLTAVTMKNVSSGTLRRVALVRTDVSEEPSASSIRVTRIGELGTTLAVTSNRRTFVACVVTLMKEALGSPKRRFLQEPHGITSQKTPFFKLNMFPVY